MKKESKDEKDMREEGMKKAQEANQSRNEERLKLMEQIADTSEMGRVDEEPEVEKEIKAAEEEAKKIQEEIPPEAPEPTPKTYKLTINGKDREFTEEQLIASASKVESADDYLRSAAEAARTQAAGAPSKPDEPPSLDEDQIADLYRKQALGDEDAIRALAKLHVRPSLSRDALQAIDQRLSFRTELAALEAKSSDLLKDPYMGRLFRARIQELKQSDPMMGLSEAYQAIDGELRRAFPGFKSSKLNEKLERKRTLPQLPVASGKEIPEAEEEGEEDPAQVIEKMAKARGVIPHVHNRRQ